MIGQAGQHDVVAQGGLEHQAGTAAVLGDHAQVVLNGVLGAPEVDLLALYKYLTCIRPAAPNMVSMTSVRPAPTRP